MSLFRLPSEILNAIANQLDGYDCRQLCQTCRPLMNALQKKAYRCIILDERAGSGSDVMALASGPRAKFVRYIQYSPLGPKPTLGWEEDGRESEHEKYIVLSDQTREVLESLYRFVGLVRFRLILGGEDEGWDIGNWPMVPLSMSYFSFDEYHKAHDEEPWRILLEESLTALSKSAGAFSKLEIKRLPPIPIQQPYKVFETDQWKALLSKLTSLEITLPETYDQGSGNLTVYHQEFLQNFPQMFLDHLPNVEHLRIAGKDDAVIGKHEYPAPFSWKPLQMPRLKIFELEYSFLEEGLVSFLLNHTETLEQVYLRHCLGESKDDWKHLFQGFVDQDASRLVEVRIPAYPVPKRSFYPNDSEWEEVWRKMLKDLEEKEENFHQWTYLSEHYNNAKDDGNVDESEADGTVPTSGGTVEAMVMDLNSDDGRENQTSLMQDEDGEEEQEDGEGEGEEDDEEDEEDEEDDGEEDEDNGEEEYRNGREQRYVETRRHWEEVVVDEKCRRFVVADTSESYGQIFPVESHPEDELELDESDVVEIWEKLELLVRRNRTMVESSKSVHHG